MLENQEIQGISGDLLNVHGIVPGTKPERVTRLIYENPDGFNRITATGVYLRHRFARTRRRSGLAKYRQRYVLGLRSGKGLHDSVRDGLSPRVRSPKQDSDPF